jgi:hypothetical protein
MYIKIQASRREAKKREDGRWDPLEVPKWYLKGAKPDGTHRPKTSRERILDDKYRELHRRLLRFSHQFDGHENRQLWECGLLGSYCQWRKRRGHLIVESLSDSDVYMR